MQNYLVFRLRLAGHLGGGLVLLFFPLLVTLR